MDIAELRARLAEIRERVAAIHSEHGESTDIPDEIREEWDDLNAEYDVKKAKVDEFDARSARVIELGQHADATERAVPDSVNVRVGRSDDDLFDLTTIRASLFEPDRMADEMGERARRIVDNASFPSVTDDDGRTQVQALLDKEREEIAMSPVPRVPEVSMRILTTGSPEYRRAFNKAVAGMPLSPEESRALSLTTTAGGFAVPYTLDPTIIKTSNYAVNPFRAISRVQQITTDDWKGVSSAGVTAAYAAEAAQASDNAPTLAQPTVSAERAQCWIPFSYEIGQDWGSLAAEMAALLQDAKDELEASKFATGSGSDEPFGLVTGATTTVAPTTDNTFAVADLYKIEEALPPRFRPMAQWVANRAIYNKVRQFDTAGGANLWTRLADGLLNNPGNGNTGYDLIGYHANEASAMSSTIADAEKVLILGDFRHFLIVDRIGMSVELIPQVFGANQRPTGQRGFYAFWRNGSKVLAAGAFRTLSL